MRQFRILTIAVLIVLIVGTLQSASPAGAINQYTISATPTYLYFGNQIVGTTSPTQTITIKNTGSTDVTLGAITITTATGTREFILRALECNGKNLLPSETCQFTVAFRPTSVAYKTGTVNIPNSETASPMTISLTGYGVSGTNLLRAPNFELPLPKPLPWKSYPTTFSLQYALDCSVSLSLYCSAKLSGTNNNISLSLQQSVGRVGVIGDRYLFRLSSRASAIPTDGQYKVEVLLLNMYNQIVGRKSVSFSNGTHDFETVTGIITARAQYSWVLFQFVLQKPSGIAWFDSAQLIYLP